MDKVGNSNWLNSNYQTGRNRQVNFADFFGFRLCLHFPRGFFTSLNREAANRNREMELSTDSRTWYKP